MQRRTAGSRRAQINQRARTKQSGRRPKYGVALSVMFVCLLTQEAISNDVVTLLRAKSAGKRSAEGDWQQRINPATGEIYEYNRKLGQSRPLT